MSYPRTKISRPNDREPKFIKEHQSETMNKTLDKTQKSEKPLPFTRRLVKPLLKQRSLSQPSSNTGISKNPQRPHSSGGDDKNVLAGRNRLGKISASEEHSDDEHFESATMIKASHERLSKLEENTKAESQTDDKTKSSTPDGDNPMCKVSSSGIPLRIKQQQANTKASPATGSKKPSPRTPKLISTSTAANEQPKGISPITMRGLETQFQNKKKRMQQLKKDIVDRQKPLLDTYQALLQLKKKLEQCGKTIPLEELKMEDYVCPHGTDPSTDTHAQETKTATPTQEIKVDPEIIKHMEHTIKEVPLSLLEICRNLMTKRMVLVELLEKLMQQPMDQEQLEQNIHALREETVTLEQTVADIFVKHDKDVLELVEKWEVLFKNSGSSTPFNEQVVELQEKIKEKEQKVAELMVEMQEAQRKNEEENSTSERTISELKDKIKLVEQEINREKVANQDQREKFNMNDQRMKVLKTRIKELEIKQKEAETKCVELQKAHRHAQEQLKANEHRWVKEKEEMLTKHKNDRQMLEKLTKDRSFFETRVKTLEELVEDKENKYKMMEERFQEELEATRKAAAEDRTKKESMQQKYDSIKDQLVHMEIRNRQAIDLVHSKNTFEPSETEGITTEREAELYTELLATRVALKAAEDQIQNYNREKLRFIDSIQSLQGDPEKDQDYIAKTLIKNVEKITELESKLTESEEIICNQKIEIANLKVDVENLRQRPAIMSAGDLDNKTAKDGDLKMMLHEGRIKLEQSLKKSLEYEHKIIRYEHDINRQSKQICEMENLLKVRDGLISMMKAKKDELQMENDSLNKYANEIRDLLIQAKEEARNRTELVQELSSNLDTRGRVCQQLERKVKELEGSLTITNEKRFKLQDAIGAMEKELQNTKAHINRLAPDVQSRTRLKSYKKW